MRGELACQVSVPEAEDTRMSVTPAADQAVRSPDTSTAEVRSGWSAGRVKVRVEPVTVAAFPPQVTMVPSPFRASAETTQTDEPPE